MKRKIIAVIAGILIFGWAYWLVPYSPIPDTVNITEMRVYQLDRGEYADDFTERVDTDTVRELLVSNPSLASEIEARIREKLSEVPVASEPDTEDAFEPENDGE